MSLEFYAIQQILFLIVRPSGGMVYRFSVVVVYELTYPTADAWFLNQSNQFTNNERTQFVITWIFANKQNPSFCIYFGRIFDLRAFLPFRVPLYPFKIILDWTAGNCPVIGCSFFRPHIFKLLYSFLSNSIIRTLPGYIRIFVLSPFSQHEWCSKHSIFIFLASCAISGNAPRVNICEQ